MSKQEVISLLEGEIIRCRMAQKINGCPLTEDWKRTIEVCEIAIDAIKAQEARRWIPVSERLPDNGQKVVFFNYGSDAVYAGKFNYIGARGTVWFRAGKTSYPGSYWMPMPEPPKEGANNG